MGAASMLMRFRIFSADVGGEVEGEAKPVACAANRPTAETCAEALSRESTGVLVVVDYGNHEDPEIESTWRKGARARSRR